MPATIGASSWSLLLLTTHGDSEQELPRPGLDIDTRMDARHVGTTASTGTASFPLPQALGEYQVRSYAAGHVTAVSAAVDT